nr:VRR-NUC domain-containing protein [Pseudomonas sp. RIT-PI-S]
MSNFEQALAWLRLRYDDVLDAAEREFIEGFAHLPQGARALLVRLVMRKGAHFRRGKLAYEEIGDASQAAAPLLSRGWLVADAALSLADLFTLFGKAELRQGFAEHALPATARKGEWFEALAPLHGRIAPLSEWWPGHEDAVWQLAVRPLCERLRLLFFGNLRQDWSQFVVVELGIQRFESVDFAPHSRAFRHRQDLDVALGLAECAQALEEGADTAVLLQALTALVSDNPWLASRRQKTLFRLAQRCERSGDWPQAANLYADCRWPGARLRRLRMLERSERFGEAMALAEQASQAPENAAEAQGLERLLPRLRRALGDKVRVRRASQAVVRLDLCLPPQRSVERAVCEALNAEQAPVMYVENTLFNALFGLLCWPALFAPVPGAFFHPFQAAPLDLHQADFAQRREAELAACLAQLHSDAYRATILDRFASKFGLANPFVHWGAVDEPLLRLALACIPAEHLRLCFERLLQDVKANRAGMPDLIQFFPATAGYQMIEVKGPGDRLQDNQLRWIAFCQAHGLPVSVCHVRWQVPATSAQPA